MRMRKKKNLLPRMERCEAYQIKDPYERKGRWHDLMPEAKEIRVELGCGKGRFTVYDGNDARFFAPQMLEHADYIAYAIDPETRELLFANAKMLSLIHI